jgi:opacity protein-like surface antigen
MKKLILTSTLAILAISAQAQTAGFYAGTEIFNNRFTDHTSTTGGGVFAGYRLGNGVAFEVNGNRLGSLGQGNDKSSVSQMSISALYSLPVSSSVSVYGRLGYGNMRFSQANSFSNRGVKLDDGVIYGGGISYQISKQVDIRGEFRKPHDEIRGFGVGASYNF